MYLIPLVGNIADKYLTSCSVLTIIHFGVKYLRLTLLSIYVI